MKRRRDLTRGGAAVVAAAALCLAGLGTTFSAFTSRADSGGNKVSAAADFRAPNATATVAGKTALGTPGWVKQGGTYYVYANVSADTGNPASGIASVVANVSALTTGATAVALSAGSYTAGGVAYNYRSAAQTANGSLAEGARAFTLTATDNASNADIENGSATVDNTAPAAADVQTTNAGTAGRAEQNDTVVLTFSEPVEPGTILAGWDGTSTPVVVRMTDNGLLGLGTDDAQIFNAANTTLLPLGTVNLNRVDYVGGLIGGRIEFGDSGTASTMVMSGSAITVTLGTYSTVGLLVGRGTAGGNGTTDWRPVATPTDRAANVLSTAIATESGAGDKEF